MTTRSFALVFLIGLFLKTSLGVGGPLGYCPTGAPSVCSISLPQAVRILTNCPLTSSPDVESCGYIFVKTLASIDARAPYYIGVSEKNIQVGDRETYKRMLDALKLTQPETVQVLYRLSMAVILQYAELTSLDDEKRRELDNMLENMFEAIENLRFDQSNTEDRANFIQTAVTQAQQIVWPEFAPSSTTS